MAHSIAQTALVVDDPIESSLQVIGTLIELVGEDLDAAQDQLQIDARVVVFGSQPNRVAIPGGALAQTVDALLWLLFDQGGGVLGNGQTEIERRPEAELGVATRLVARLKKGRGRLFPVARPV